MPFIPDSQSTTRTGFVPDKKTMGGFLGNVAGSGAKFVGDTVGAVANVFNPNMDQNTLATILKLGESIIEVAIPGEQGNEDMAMQVGQYYAQRYGGLDKAWNSFYTDPVGVAMDASVVLGGAGAALKGAGAASKASGLTRAGEIASKAGRVIDPISQVTRFAGKGASKLAKKVGANLEETGNKMITRGIGNPAQMADLGKKSKTTMSDFIKKYNLYDRSPETAAAVKKSIMSQYDDLALKSGKQIPLKDVIGQMDDEITRLSTGPSKFSDAAQTQIAELARRRDQLLQVAGKTENIGVDTLTEFRRQAIDPDIPKSMFNLDARGSGTAQGAKATRDILKRSINSTDPRLERLGLDYGMAKGTEKILSRSQSRANNRQLFNFTKLGSAGIGSVVAGAPGVVAGFALEQAVNNPKFIAAASKALEKTGKALQSEKANKVAASVGKVVGPAYQAGKMSRFLTNPQKQSKSANKQTAPQSQIKLPYTQSVAPSALTYKTKNVFKNKSAFGKVPRIKLSSSR